MSLSWPAGTATGRAKLAHGKQGTRRRARHGRKSTEARCKGSPNRYVGRLRMFLCGQWQRVEALFVVDFSLCPAFNVGSVPDVLERRMLVRLPHASCRKQTCSLTSRAIVSGTCICLRLLVPSMLNSFLYHLQGCRHGIRVRLHPQAACILPVCCVLCMFLASLTPWRMQLVADRCGPHCH